MSEGDLLRAVRENNSTPGTSTLIITRNAYGNSQSKEGSTPLHLAIATGYVKMVAMLLNHDADINAQERSGNTPLHCAVKRGCSQIIELFISRNANVNVQSKDGTTPLHLAIDNDDEEIVEMLLNRNADINAPRFYGHTPLHCAVMKNSFKMIKLLVSRNANVNAASEEGSPLFTAVKSDQFKITEYLLNHGADVNFAHCGIIEKITPLYYASQTGSEKLIKLLLSKGADVNIPSDAGYTALYVAINMHRQTIVKLLLQHGADVNTICSNKWTALTIAVAKQDMTMIEDVLKYQPDVNIPGSRKAFKHAIKKASDKNGREIVKKFSEYGFTCNCKESNNPKIVRSVVKNGFLEMAEDIFKYVDDINKADFNNRRNLSLLHIAIHHKNSEMTTVLIRHGADVNTRDKRGKPVIFYAVEMCDVKSFELLLGNGVNVKDFPKLLVHAVKAGCIEIVESLLQPGLGFDINAKHKFELSALHYAALGPHDTCICLGSSKLPRTPQCDGAMCKITQILLRNGANVNDQCKSGRTALHIAVITESIGVIEALLEYNADVNFRADGDMTPLHYCAENQKAEICEMLLNKGSDANARRLDGRTVLHLASQKNGINVIKMILNYVPQISSGVIQDEESSLSARNQRYSEIRETTLNLFVDIDCRDRYGETALDIAVNGHKYTVVEVLLSYGASITLKSFENLSSLYYHSDRSPCSRIVVGTPLHAHMLRTKALGLHWSAQNEYFAGLEDNDNHYEDEVKKMKNERSSGTNVSIYDFLTKDVDVLAAYSRNKFIMRALNSGVYNEKFKLFANMINGTLIKGQKRYSLLIPSVISFNILFRRHLPDVVTYEILAYLNNVDLFNMIKACYDVADKQMH